MAQKRIRRWRKYTFKRFQFIPSASVKAKVDSKHWQHYKWRKKLEDVYWKQCHNVLTSHFLARHATRAFSCWQHKGLHWMHLQLRTKSKLGGAKLFHCSWILAPKQFWNFQVKIAWFPDPVLLSLNEICINFACKKFNEVTSIFFFFHPTNLCWRKFAVINFIFCENSFAQVFSIFVLYQYSVTPFTRKIDGRKARTHFHSRKCQFWNYSFRIVVFQENFISWKRHCKKSFYNDAVSIPGYRRCSMTAVSIPLLWSYNNWLH